MTIKLTPPNGLTAEVNTVDEASALLKVLDGQPSQPSESVGATKKYPKGMKRVYNRDLDVLQKWGLNDHEIRRGMSTKEWEAVADMLDRTVQGAKNLSLRFCNGGYEHNGTSPNARTTIIHANHG